MQWILGLMNIMKSKERVTTMTLDIKTIRNREERGNALFLILIAVALFAALSYAITQSGRGGGNIGTQTALITAGQVTEAPADTRAAVARMILSGVAPASVAFVASGGTLADDVFDQTGIGGGATNVPPPAAACVALADCTASWVYVPAYATTGNFVAGLGSAGANGSDAFAVLQGTSGVTKSVCSAINSGLGMPAAAVTTPPFQLVAPVAWGTVGAYAAGGSATTVHDTNSYLNSQDFACFNNTLAGSNYAYYAVMIDQ
jgi:hypothetical protein